MKYQVVIIALVLSMICVGVFGQAPWASVKICAVACSDGSTYAQCIDMFGGPSSGDCSYAGIACPPPLQSVSYVYDFGEKDGLAFTSVQDCQVFFDNMRRTPNLPKVVDGTAHANIDVRSRTGSGKGIKEAMEWHKDFSMYTEEEQLLLGQRIIAAANGNNRTRSYSEEEVRDVARSMFGFVKNIRENTEETGVYTNSKCAGCSLIVQSIEEKLTGDMCDKLTNVIKDSVCGSNPVFELFCDALEDIGIDNLELIVQNICVQAINGVAEASGIRETANYICSTLTCTSQPEEITSEADIMGSCELKENSKSYNERCDELLRICDLAEKGICIADAVLEIQDELSGGWIKAGVNIISSLVQGELPAVAESAQKLAVECSNVKCGGEVAGAGTKTPVWSWGLIMALLLILSQL